MHRLFTSALTRTALKAALMALTVAAAQPALAAEDKGMAAVYCASDELPFIGELLPSMRWVTEDPKAKAELALTPLQQTKLRESEENFDAGLKSWLNNQPPSPGKATMAEIKGVGKMVEEARKRTGDVLKPHQLSRLRELMLQRVGLLSIPKKDLQQVLRLERSQERSIDEIRSSVFAGMDKKAKVVATDGRCKLVRAPATPEMSRLLAESEKSVYRLLSKEQKEMVEKLKGKR
ncbi:MAG TPA: hypothetical protein VJ550_06430 [Geomonas sp.]|nr:hypothetical protein [Geomonas sp.]